MRLQPSKNGRKELVSVDIRRRAKYSKPFNGERHSMDPINWLLDHSLEREVIKPRTLSHENLSSVYVLVANVVSIRADHKNTEAGNITLPKNQIAHQSICKKKEYKVEKERLESYVIRWGVQNLYAF